MDAAIAGFILMLGSVLGAFIFIAKQLIPILRRGKLYKDTRGQLSITPILATIAIVISAIITLLVLADLSPDFFGAGADIVNVFNTETTNNTTADAILPTLGIIVAFAVPFAVLGLVLLAVKLA